jgi:hypothetical protein
LKARYAGLNGNLERSFNDKAIVEYVVDFAISALAEISKVFRDVRNKPAADKADRSHSGLA